MEVGRFERFIESKRTGFRKMLERNRHAKKVTLHPISRRLMMDVLHDSRRKL